ncbi:MAG: hypothetical protein GY714_19855 [Desulfobacterales bacterium]|nr:hypothetical protein [Desulfobacterales bacterium]
MSYNYIVTTKGLDLIAMVQADPTKKIEFIRAEIGNGKPEDVVNPETYNSLIGSIKKDATIQNKELLSDESVKITISYDNEFVTTGFIVHEVGLYVKDPNDDSKEILFLYCNSSEADFLPDNSSAVNVEQVVNLILKMSNTENVSVTATSSSNVIRENFVENTILKADVAGEPVSLKVDNNTLIGRKGNDSDKIEDLTPDDARDILNVPELVEGKISNEHNNISNSPRQAILSLNDISYKTSNVKIADEHSYTGNGVVRELDFGMDFVTQNSVNQFGGIAFGKNILGSYNIRFADSDMSENQHLYLSHTDVLKTNDTEIRSFSEKGLELGSYQAVNNSGDESEFYAFQTTKKEQKKVYEDVKSVVLKCHNNYGGIDHLGFRRIEFYNGDTRYDLTPSDYTTYATTEHDERYKAENAFNTSLSLIGSHEYNEWLTDNELTNQSLVIVFNSPIDITHIDINNSHHNGTSYTDFGVKDLDVIFTDQTLEATHTVWESSIPNGETVWSGRLSPHVTSDVADPETIMYTPWRYNSNNGFAFHTRTGRGVAEQVKNPPEMDGMKLCFRFTKDVESTSGWGVYSDKLPATQGLYLNLSNPPSFSGTYNNNEEPDLDHYTIGNSGSSDRGHIIKDYCFFGKDLSYIEPGLTGVEGATAFMMCDPGQIFDCGFEPQIIITKSLEVQNNWLIFTKNNGFKDAIMYLSDIQSKITLPPEHVPGVNGKIITSPTNEAYGKCLIMAFAEVVSVPAENKIINTLAKSSPGTLADREVDMGMDLASGDNGGMVLTKGGTNSWGVFDTVRGPLKALYTNIESTEISDDEFVKEFTKNGIKVGTHKLVNGTSDQFYMGFQTDEKIKPPKWKAKSVVFDIADNYGATDYIRLRSIEFYKDDTLISLLQSDFTIYSAASNSTYEPENIFITGKSKTGSDENNGWRSTASTVANLRIVIVFNAEIEFDKVVINNGHEDGTNTTSGAKFIDTQITDHNYKNSTYGAVVTGSANQIFKSEILQHPEADIVDDKTYVDISDEWQINRASGFGMCKIKGTQADRVLKTPYGKEPCMLWVKNLQNEWYVYFHSIGETKVLHLHLSNMENQTSLTHFDEKAFTKEEFYLGKLLSTDSDFMIYAWFGDYFQDTATGEISTVDQKRVMGEKGTSAFFKGSITGKGTQTYKTHIDDIETIIWKTRGGLTGHWNIINKSLNNFQDRYFLNTTDSKQAVSADPAISINGSEITVTTTNNDHDNYLFMVFGRNAEKDTKEYIPWMNQVNHVGTGETDTSIDLGMDFTGENGGMILHKHLNEAWSWIISDTLRGSGKELHTDGSNAESVSSETIKEFTEDGIKVGTADRLNRLNSEIATFGFQTTHKTQPTRRTVKSAVFKLADAWGGGNMGVRRIEFYKKDVLTNNDVLINLTESDFDVYATNEYTLREAKNAFITSGFKKDSADNTSWYTSQNSEQVLIIVFKTAKEVDYIRVDNFHHNGTLIDEGVRNAKVYFTEEDLTEDKYSNFSFNDEVPNSELVYDGVFDQHHASNAECYTQYLYTPWHYNPQTGFGFFTHKGNGTEIKIENVFGKQPTMIWTKNLNDSSSWVTYSKVVGEKKYGVLDTDVAINLSETEFFKEINSNELKFGLQNNVNDLNDNHISYVWVGDDMSTLGNPQEAFGVVGTSLFTEKKSADSEIELGFKPDTVLTKKIASSHWAVHCRKNKENIFDSYVYLNNSNVITTRTEGNNSNFWIEGTKLRFGTDWVGDRLICAFAKDTYKPQGKSIVIHGSESKPSLFSIANGFNKYQAVDKLIGYDRNVVFSFNEGDGTYYIKLNMDGTITLKNQNCFYGDTNPNNGQDFFDVEEYKMFSPSGSVVPGIYIGKIVIQNDAILDVQKFQTGTKAKVDWFPVSNNSMYIKDNPFFTNEIDWDIWWNSTDSDDNRRHVGSIDYYNDGSGGRGTGASKRQTEKELIVGTGLSHVYHSNTSGDPIYSNSGYYKLIIRRNF